MESATMSPYEQWLARRDAHIRLCASGGEDDRLSTLPDDVLRLIIERLDTRSALATAALSKQWARLPRDLPVLDFKVRDVLPERYRRYLHGHLDRGGKSDALVRTLGRYERRGTRSLAKSLTSFLDADDAGGEEAASRRTVHALALEMFPTATHNAAPFNRLIAAAVAKWGAEDLEIVVLNPTGARHGGGVRYTFPHHALRGSKSPPVLRKLKLSNCAPLAARANGTGWLRKPRAFGLLTVLV